LTLALGKKLSAVQFCISLRLKSPAGKLRGDWNLKKAKVQAKDAAAINDSFTEMKSFDLLCEFVIYKVARLIRGFRAALSSLRT
jgi:hypothetical protein